MRDAPLTFEVFPGLAPDTLVVRLDGPLTLINLFGFQDEMRRLEATLIVLDFSLVPYMDSAGLGSVVNLYVSTQKSGRRIGLVAVNPRVLAIFQQTRVDQVLPFYTSLAGAEAAV
jgi:anti-anti-sigma factor